MGNPFTTLNGSLGAVGGLAFQSGHGSWEEVESTGTASGQAASGGGAADGLGQRRGLVRRAGRGVGQRVPPRSRVAGGLAAAGVTAWAGGAGRRLRAGRVVP